MHKKMINQLPPLPAWGAKIWNSIHQHASLEIIRRKDLPTDSFRVVGTTNTKYAPHVNHITIRVPLCEMCYITSYCILIRNRLWFLIVIIHRAVIRVWWRVLLFYPYKMRCSSRPQGQHRNSFILLFSDLSIRTCFPPLSPTTNNFPQYFFTKQSDKDFPPARIQKSRHCWACTWSQWDLDTLPKLPPANDNAPSHYSSNRQCRTLVIISRSNTPSDQCPIMGPTLVRYFSYILIVLNYYFFYNIEAQLRIMTGLWFTSEHNLNNHKTIIKTIHMLQACNVFEQQN